VSIQDNKLSIQDTKVSVHDKKVSVQDKKLPVQYKKLSKQDKKLSVQDKKNVILFKSSYHAECLTTTVTCLKEEHVKSGTQRHARDIYDKFTPKILFVWV